MVIAAGQATIGVVTSSSHAGPGVQCAAMNQPGQPEQNPADNRYMEIRPTSTRRWIGFLIYVLSFAGLTAALVWFLLYYSAPVALAVGVAAFMVLYMLIMGWWTGRNLENKR